MILHFLVLHLEHIGMMNVYVVDCVNKNSTNVQRVLWIDMVFPIVNMIIRGRSIDSIVHGRMSTFFLSCRRFFYQCSACQKNLFRNDLIQRAKSNMYHVDCFRCEACRKCLTTGDGKIIILLRLSSMALLFFSS